VSGFAGIVRMEPTPETAEADRFAVERMASAIAFRGPDALQQFHQPGASFAFSLLITGPAPQETSQPCTVDGEEWLLGDVRCDDRAELILKGGLRLDSPATSEQLILHYFAKFGEPALPELHGDFSFVLWNPRLRRLLAFRDLTGSRPFFYAYRNGMICFSNTLQAVLSHPTVCRGEYDLQFIGDFLLGSPHYDSESSVYRDIRRLPAGHLLELSPRGFSVRRIANFPIDELLQLSDREVIEEFRRLFTQSVTERLPAADTSILLSGGLDSTSIAAVAASLRKQQFPRLPLRLHALCVDFQPLFDDQEGHYASRFSEAIQIPLRLLHSGDALPFSGWDDSAAALPEPLMDPYSLLYLSYRKEVSRNARVVLSGDGGDEVLRLQAAPYLRFLFKQQSPMTAVSTLALAILSHRGLPPLGFGIRSGFLRLLGRKPAEWMYPPWLSDDFEGSHGLASRWHQMCASPGSVHPFNPKAYNAMNSGFLGDVLELTDPVWTGVPLETRNPFLDRRLCRFLLRIPVIPWALEKHLIRVSFQDVLPDEIRLRPKTPVLQDPLVLQTAAGRWDPVPICAPPAPLRSLVDWPKVVQSVECASGTSLYVHLRPVALALWLNAVEKDN
jgi:asparagine synthase (glutamine-hydrolysing)